MIILPLRFRVIVIISITLIICAFVIIQRSSKSKSEYDRITGVVTMIGKSFGDLPYRDLGKYRYIKLEGYSYPFELFIGNESGDFKPKFEKIDGLNVGDTISVYGYETSNTQEVGVNRFAQFIEKHNELYFERGSSGKTLGFVILGLSTLLVLFSFIMLKLKKITY
jgi:hypothetical protein